MSLHWFLKVKDILRSPRRVMIPAFKASKEFHDMVKAVAIEYGWSMSQTIYILASLGLDVVKGGE